MRLLLMPWEYLPFRGGLEIGVSNIAARLIDKDIKTIIITRKISKALRRIERIDGIPVFRTYPNFYWSKNLYWRSSHPLQIIFRMLVHLPIIFGLIKIVKRFKVDIINLHYPTPAALYVFLIAKILKKKVVVSLHGELTQGVHYASRFEKKLFKYLLKKADFVTACSKSLLEEATKLVPDIARKSRYIYNGISSDYYISERRDDAPVHNNKYILTIANLWPYKGLDILLMAMAAVCDKRNDVDLIIAGQGGERKKLADMAKMLKIEDRVIFKGAVNDEAEKKRLLHTCEFFVLSSRIEPFGIVNLEAMAAGKAIVATRTGGIPEIVKDGENGILVEPYSDKALAGGIMKLLDDKELRDKLGRNGRKMVEDPKFSWDNITDQYIETYNDVLR